MDKVFTHHLHKLCRREITMQIKHREKKEAILIFVRKSKEIRGGITHEVVRDDRQIGFCCKEFEDRWERILTNSTESGIYGIEGDKLYFQYKQCHEGESELCKFEVVACPHCGQCIEMIELDE